MELHKYYTEKMYISHTTVGCECPSGAHWGVADEGLVPGVWVGVDLEVGWWCVTVESCVQFN